MLCFLGVVKVYFRKMPTVVGHCNDVVVHLVGVYYQKMPTAVGSDYTFQCRF